ncbi:MAG: preprotein translocase subunit SecE [Thermoleophilaceae bacterium]|jgi:preprotein translocase SecE subunit|nr:preprotein translocase subunit SecE [Thermoleophilaceae bacterium]
MARNRQRAKQRQAERRARRLPDEGTAPAQERDDQAIDDPTAVDPSPAVPPELAAGAPPQDEGFSERLVERDPVFGDRPSFGGTPASEEEALDEIEDWEVEDPEDAIAAGGAGEAGYEVRGRRGHDEAQAHKDRPRVVQFLVAVWAELQRVQWPNRQALVTLTGVVLGFVLIAGGYLGLLDAIFSQLIKAIL